MPITAGRGHARRVEPAAGLFPFLLLIFLGWSLACGDHRLLPLTVLVASFVTQTHLMYVAPTAVVLTFGFGGLLLRALARRRTTSADRQSPLSRPRIWPWALAAVLVAAACWTEPAIDQIENRPGNFAVIAHTVEHRGATLGATVGWTLWSARSGSGPGGCTCRRRSGTARRTFARHRARCDRLDDRAAPRARTGRVDRRIDGAMGLAAAALIGLGR